MAVSVTAGRDRDRDFSTINITPLVDVMLVLLVIFLLAMPVWTRTLPVQLPTAGPVQKAPPPRLQLEVGAGGDWSLDGSPIARDALAVEIAAQLARAPATVVELRAAADADYQAFAAALAEVRSGGARQIALQR